MNIRREAFLRISIHFNQYLLSDSRGASAESGALRSKSMKPSCLFESASSIRGVTRPHGPAIRNQEETTPGTKREECLCQGQPGQEGEGCAQGDQMQRALEGWHL